MKKFAVFDIDGTLYRWQLYHELVQTLALSGKMPEIVFTELDMRWNQWRGGTMSFDNYEHYVISTMLHYLPTISTDDFMAACDKVVADSTHKTHHFPTSLLKNLKSKGYATIAISGSQQELVEGFGTRHGIDICVGALYERKDGRFTGAVIRPTVGRKPDLLREIVTQHNLDWTGSLAIGDSDGDASLLELVERPIAFNPSAGLFARAKAAGWPVVIERKNIAYTLEKRGHVLVLADTVIY